MSTTISFTVMAAVLIHKGSAESRDSDDLIQEALKRIQDEAIEVGRELARKKKVGLVIRGEDGTVRKG